MYPVFVYGTLKRKQINHVLLEGVGIARIRPAWLAGAALYNIADPQRPYSYPAIVFGRGVVLGELIDLQNIENGLLVLDHLECEGFEYLRKPCWVRVAGRLERAWVYVYASQRLLRRMRATPYPRPSWVPHKLEKRLRAM
ncbi:MAG: gamma-glutamylcyclotransferase family protein [Deinococcales bacterium]